MGNKIFGLRNLTDRDVISAARRYDLSPRDRLVIDSAKQADDLHGQMSYCSATGQPCVSWATDGRGYYRASNLLDGYLSEETRVMRCDALAHDRFCRDAYGD